MSFDEEMFYNRSAYENAYPKWTPEERERIFKERKRLWERDRQRDNTNVYLQLAKRISGGFEYDFNIHWQDMGRIKADVENLENKFKAVFQAEMADVYKEIHDADTLNRHNHATAAKDIILIAKELRELKERVEVSDHNLNQKCRTSITLLSNEIQEMKDMLENLMRHLDEPEPEEAEEAEEAEDQEKVQSKEEEYASLLVSLVFLGLLVLTMMFLPLLQAPKPQPEPLMLDD